MKKPIFLVIFLLVFFCIPAYAEPLSDAYGSFQYTLPDGYSFVGGDKEKRTYKNKENTEIQVGELLSLDQAGINQFLDAPETVIAVFSALEDLVIKSSPDATFERVFIGDLPAEKLSIPKNNLDMIGILNRYDSICIILTSPDGVSHSNDLQYIFEHIYAEITPLK